jgi:hypothetical protein
MLFMLRMSLEILPLTVFLPELWIALVGLLALALLTRRRAPVATPLRSHGPLSLFVLLPVPLIMLAWGLYFWPTPPAARSDHETMALVVLNAFALIEFALAVWLVWRRHRALPLMTAIACLALFWTAGARFVSSMAITNTWL